MTGFCGLRAQGHNPTLAPSRPDKATRLAWLLGIYTYEMDNMGIV